MNKKFINTSDAETADILRELGFYELPKKGDKWVFVNENKTLVFSSPNMKVSYTDVLTF